MKEKNCTCTWPYPNRTISAVLVKEDGKIQKPIYYVSKVLHEAELNYSKIEKFALALITTSRKLRPYFQAHRIEVLTDQPLRNIMHSPKVSGRLIKWTIELGEFDIQYKPRVAIKAQALADFVVECTIDKPRNSGGRTTWRLINPKTQKKSLKNIGISILMGHQNQNRAELGWFYEVLKVSLWNMRLSWISQLQITKLSMRP